MGVFTLLIVVTAVLTASIPVAAIDIAPHAATAEPAGSALESGSDYWQGFHLRFDGTNIVENPTTASPRARTFQVRAVDNGAVGGLVTEFTIDENGTAVIDTSAMSGPMIVQYQGDNVYVEDGEGSLTLPDGGAATVERSDWNISTQTYSTEWSDPTVYPGEFTDLTLASNRESASTVAVSAEQLTFRELVRLFSSDAFAENFGERADEDVLILKAGASRDYQVAATGLTPGVYTLTFASTDTTAEHSVTLEVKDGGKFDALERGEHAGDLIQASINCTECYLVAGGLDEGFVDLVELKDGNGDGVVDLTINTRYIGLQPSASHTPSDIKPYYSTTDSVNQLRPSYQLSNRSAKDQLGTLRTDLGLRSQGRTAPVEPGPVDFTVTTSDFLMARSQYGEHRAPLGDDLVVRHEQDVSTVDLREPVLGKIETYGQPSRFGIDRNLTAVTNRLPSAPRVAIGDELIVRVDIGGLYGYLDYAGATPASVANNVDEGIALKIGRSGGRPGLPIDLPANQLDVDERADRLYVAIDTSRRAISRELDPGATYTVTFTLTGVDGRAGDYDLTGTEEQSLGYPYLAPGESQRVTTTVTFVQPTATVTAPDSTLKRPNRNPVTISGTTTLAPDSAIAVTAEGPWSKTTSTTVQPDGTWTATFDFSNTKVGDSFTVTVKKQSEVLAQTSGRIVEPSEVPDRPTPGTPGMEGPGTATPGNSSSDANSSQGTTTAAPDGPDGSPSNDGATNGGLLGSIFGGVLGGAALSGFLLPIVAVVGIFALIALVIGRLR